MSRRNLHILFSEISSILENYKTFTEAFESICNETPETQLKYKNELEILTQLLQYDDELDELTENLKDKAFWLGFQNFNIYLLKDIFYSTTESYYGFDVIPEYLLLRDELKILSPALKSLNKTVIASAKNLLGDKYYIDRILLSKIVDNYFRSIKNEIGLTIYNFPHYTRILESFLQVQNYSELTANINLLNKLIEDPILYFSTPSYKNTRALISTNQKKHVFNKFELLCQDTSDNSKMKLIGMARALEIDYKNKTIEELCVEIREKLYSNM